MQYLKTSLKGIYVAFDETNKTAVVIDKTEAQKELEFNQAQLASLPATPADKDLLIWAKENYPRIEGIEQSKQLIESEITKLQTQLASCK